MPKRFAYEAKLSMSMLPAQMFLHSASAAMQIYAVVTKLTCRMSPSGTGTSVCCCICTGPAVRPQHQQDVGGAQQAQYPRSVPVE